MKNKSGNDWTRRQKRNFVSSGKTILIVTEGEKTEPSYLIALRNRLRLSSTDVVVSKADGTDPASVVNFAIERVAERKRKAKKSTTIVPYDSVWAVFDTERYDTNPKLKDAITIAKNKKINLAISNPCFEYWVLLHFEYTTAQFASCDEVIRRIESKRHIQNYDKAKLPNGILIERIPIAVTNSEKCRAYHTDAGVEGKNPSTEVDLLVREMNLATRPDLWIITS